MTKGECGFCSKLFSGSAMSRHLQVCKLRKSYREEQSSAMDADIFLIKVFGKDRPEYWLFVKANGSATLKNLDTFLRNIWLECCGHLSRFIINGMSYDIRPQLDYEMRSKGMNVKLSDVLRQGLGFEHEYDFGSTTHLSLKVISSELGKIKNSIQLVSRNKPPALACDSCGKIATDICVECQWRGKSLFCNNCLRKHKCGKEMSLPIVNSPRTGECGYTGKC